MPASYRPMSCPACGARMDAIEVRGVTIDSCRRCHGLWLDPGELAALTGQRQEPAGLQRSGSVIQPRACPRCGGRLLLVRWRRGLAVWLDLCLRCRGMFLDRRARQAVAGIERDPGRMLRSEENPSLRETLAYYRHRREDRDLDSGDFVFQFLSGLPREINLPPLRRPVVTWSLLAINAAVFLATWPSLRSAIEGFGLVPARLFSGEAPWAVVSSMFLHGGPLHLLGNLYFLWIMGDNVEDILGPWRYLAFYLAAGLAAGLVTAALHPGSEIPMVGASGAISGVMGAYLVGCPRAQVTFMVFLMQHKIPAAGYLIFWVALQVLGWSLGAPGVAWEAHLGGFAVGVLTLLAVRKAAGGSG